jgi:hypothetical protein
VSNIEYDPVTGLPKTKSTTTAAPTILGPLGAATGSTGATGSSGGTATTGGAKTGTLSWQDFLANDPFWKQFNTDLSAQGISDEAGAKAATQRAIIGFGEAPADLTGQAAQWIDPTTRQLAAANTQAGTSQLARVNKFNADAIRRIKNSLAARGALRSGELGFQMNENQQQYTNAQYDQRTALTDTLSGIQAGLAAAQRQAAAQKANALSQVASNYYQQAPPAGGGGGGGNGSGGSSNGGGGNGSGGSTSSGFPAAPASYSAAPGDMPPTDMDALRAALARQESERRLRAGREQRLGF